MRFTKHIMGVKMVRKSLLIMIGFILVGCTSYNGLPEQAATTSVLLTKSSTPDSGLIFEDDFSSETGSWWNGEDESGKAFITGGEYHILIYKNDRYGTCSSSGLNVQDAIVNFDVRQISGDGENNYTAFSFRSHDKDQYTFAVNNKGYFAVSKEYQGNDTSLKEWDFSPYLKTGGQTNHFTLAQSGGDFKIFFNGNLAYTFTDYDMQTGDFSFCVFPGPNSSSEYAFDNFSVHKYDAMSTYLPKKTASPQMQNYRQITWLELADFLSRDHTNWNQYVPGKYVCLDFAIDLVQNALKENLKAWIVLVDFANGDTGHAFVAFETSDKGVVYVEPQGDNPYVNVAVGNNLCDYWGKSSCMGVISRLTYAQCEHNKQCWTYNPDTTTTGSLLLFKNSTPNPTMAPTALLRNTPIPTLIPVQPTLNHPNLDITIKVTNYCSVQHTVIMDGPMHLKYVVDPGKTVEWQAAQGTYYYTIDGAPYGPQDLYVSVWTLTLCR